MQLTVKLHKLIKLAYDKGYRVTEDGRLVGLTKELDIKVPLSKHYPRFTFRCGKEYSKDGSYGIPVHTFAAYCFYGDEVFKEGIEVRHLNADLSDISKINIALGTKQENENDKSRETRLKVGQINKVKRKGSIPANSHFIKEDILNIRERFNNGESNSSIAKSYNVHRNIIRNIRLGLSYTNY